MFFLKSFPEINETSANESFSYRIENPIHLIRLSRVGFPSTTGFVCV